MVSLNYLINCMLWVTGALWFCTVFLLMNVLMLHVQSSIQLKYAIHHLYIYIYIFTYHSLHLQLHSHLRCLKKTSKYLLFNISAHILQGIAATFFQVRRKFAELISIIYSEFCMSKITTIGWFLTEIFKSKFVDVFWDTVYDKPV